MKFILVVLAAVLLCNIRFTEASDQVMDFAEMLKKLMAEYGSEPLMFDAEAELISWLTTENDTEIYEDDFVEHFGKYEVQFCPGRRYDFVGKAHKLRIDDVERLIHIDDYDLAMSLLQKFGHHIQRLYISRKFSKKILEHITTPLEMIESFKVELTWSVKNVLPLNVTFPMLSELSLDLRSDSDYSFLSCAFPSLRELNISVTPDSWKRKDQINELIRQNPEIIDIEFKGFPANYIKFIHETLPYIDVLSLYAFDTENETLEFNHLEHLALYGSTSKNKSIGPIEKLVCPGLHFLDFYYSPKDFNAWQAFFANHGDNLVDLTVQGNQQSRLTRQESLQLVGLISTLTNIQSLKVHENNMIDVAAIKPFIENHQHLRTFQYTTAPDAYDIAIVRERPGRPWQLHAYYHNERTFIGDYNDFENIVEKSRKVLEANRN